MNKYRLGALLLLPVSLFLARDNRAQDAVPIEKKYGDYERLALDPFYLSNDIWGRLGITDYEQFTFRTDAKQRFPAGWKWRWPAQNLQQVKAYPNIGFGRGPWDERSTSSWLPQRIGDLEDVTVTYDISHRAAGVYNLAFDLWITRTPGTTDPPESNIVREVMIWLDASTVDPIAGWFVATVVIDGEEYDFYKAKNNVLDFGGKFQRDYMAFRKKTPEYQGATKIHEFFRYLVKHNHLLPTEYFRNISLGNEIWHGSGETIINAYAISIQAGGQGGAASPDERKASGPTLTLPAKDAALKTTAQLRYEENAGGGNIGWWTSTADEISWDLSIPKAGDYAVTILVSCDPQFSGSVVNVTVDKKAFSFIVPDTGGWSEYQEMTLGKLTLKSGAHTVKVKAARAVNRFVGNLRSVSLIKQP